MAFYRLYKKRVIDNYLYMKDKLMCCDIYYAMKANAEKGVLQTLAEQGCKLDCASYEEYMKLKKIGVESDRILFSLPINSYDMLVKMHNEGCNKYVCNDYEELLKVCKVTPNSTKLMRIYISDLAEGSIEYGVRLDDIKKIPKEFLNKIDGICFHVSNNINISRCEKVIHRIEDILLFLKSNNDKQYIVDIGGGYSQSIDDEFYKKLNSIFEKSILKMNVRIWAEPGTAIVRNSAEYLTKIIRIIEKDNIVEVYIDGGYPHGLMHPPSKVSVVGYKEKTKRVIYKIVDNTCMRKELFSFSLKKMLKEGDVLRFEDYGAYSTIFQNDFHCWERAKIDFVE